MWDRVGGWVVVCARMSYIRYVYTCEPQPYVWQLLGWVCSVYICSVGSNTSLQGERTERQAKKGQRQSLCCRTSPSLHMQIISSHLVAVMALLVVPLGD